MSDNRGILRQVNQNSFEVGTTQEDSYIVVSRHFSVVSEMILHFRDATRIYISNVKESGGNLQYVSISFTFYLFFLIYFCFLFRIYVKQNPNIATSFIVYEIWEDESYLAIHHQSVCFRQFQKVCLFMFFFLFFV